MERYLTRREVAHFLTENGYPIGKSTIDKLSMPSRGADRRPRASGAIGRCTTRTRCSPGLRLGFARIGAHRVKRLLA